MTWASLGDADFDDLVVLAEDCLGADGGLPIAAEPGFLRRRWAVDGTASRAARDGRGRLLAAAAVRPGPAVTVLVDPEHRPRGYAAELLDWGLREAARRDGTVTVETESLTAAQAELFGSRGLRQVFAEDVMRIDLTQPVPEPVWPAGTTRLDWTAELAPRFFAVYQAAFAERPGFPGVSAETWISDVTGDEEFRPEWSVLVQVPEAGDAGFVIGAVGWIFQVGVVPAARGSGLGTALISESLTRMVAGGAVEAWLDVNVDNTAIELYRRLGFRVEGRRARYQPV